MRVFGFAGWSGSGKTTLIERLIPRFVARGLVVSLVKHAHHEFDIDQPGKDSYRHRAAGCTRGAGDVGARWALMHELRGAPELTLASACAGLSPCDLVLVEGFKACADPQARGLGRERRQAVAASQRSAHRRDRHRRAPLADIRCRIAISPTSARRGTVIDLMRLPAPAAWNWPLRRRVLNWQSDRPDERVGVRCNSGGRPSAGQRRWQLTWPARAVTLKL